VSEDVNGVPPWQWCGEPVNAATRDTDQLSFLGGWEPYFVGLVRPFDDLTSPL
jgi:hypothetical protein